jgi:hypothetical protein
MDNVQNCDSYTHLGTRKFCTAANSIKKVMAESDTSLGHTLNGERMFEHFEEYFSPAPMQRFIRQIYLKQSLNDTLALQEKSIAASCFPLQFNTSDGFYIALTLVLLSCLEIGHS